MSFTLSGVPRSIYAESPRRETPLGSGRKTPLGKESYCIVSQNLRLERSPRGGRLRLEVDGRLRLERIGTK